MGDVVGVHAYLRVVGRQHHLLAEHAVADVYLARQRFQPAAFHTPGDVLHAAEQRMAEAERIQIREHISRRVIAIRNRAFELDFDHQTGVVIGERREPRQYARNLLVLPFQGFELFDAGLRQLQPSLERRAARDESRHVCLLVIVILLTPLRRDGYTQHA